MIVMNDKIVPIVIDCAMSCVVIQLEDAPEVSYLLPILIILSREISIYT